MVEDELNVGQDADAVDVAGIAALIVNYNSTSHLEFCLPSLIDEVGAIFILDNSSTLENESDLLRALASRYDGYVPIEVVESSVNLGFGGGVNAIATRAVGRGFTWLWLVNPDTIVRPGAGRIMKGACEDFGMALVSPVITTGGNGRDIWFSGGWLDVRRGLSGHLTTPSEDLPFVSECSFLSGAAMFVSVDAWVSLGGFREDLFMYWEDADLCYRASDMALKMGVVRDAEVWHLEGGSSGSSGKSELYFYYLSRNRLVVCAGNSFEAVSILALKGFRVSVRLVVSCLSETSGRFRKFRACFRGSRDGLAYHISRP